MEHHYGGRGTDRNGEIRGTAALCKSYGVKPEPHKAGGHAKGDKPAPFLAHNTVNKVGVGRDDSIKHTVSAAET